MNKTIIWAAVLVILVGGIWYVSRSGKVQAPGVSGDSALFASSTVYENQFIKLQIPDGWTATPVSMPWHDGAVNIISGKYILYVAPQAQSAGGPEGGRFSGIAQGAPSVEDVIISHPASPCGTSDKSQITNSFFRVDLYVNNSETDQNCHKPSGSGDYWYFSYLTKDNGWYYNYYSTSSLHALVSTMSYNSPDINKLPQKGSAELTQKLGEMTAILKTLEVKTPN